MSSVSEPGYGYRADNYAAEDYMRPRRSGQSVLKALIAVIGMVPLGYMLWTIAKLLG